MAWPQPQEYNEALQNPAMNFQDLDLKAGQPELNSLGLPRAISGNFASVYRLRCGTRDWAVKCFLREISDQQERYAAISQHLAIAKLPYTVGFEYLPAGIRLRGRWYPILKMEWVQGETLLGYVQQHLRDPEALRNLAKHWISMVTALRQHGIAHGDLQHGNVLIVGGTLKLVDYDGMWVPALAGRTSTEIGHRNYQHPLRTGADFGSYLDNFSAWVIYVSLLALGVAPDLRPDLSTADEFLLFRQQDFEHPESSSVIQALEHLPAADGPLLANQVRYLLSCVDVAQVPPVREVGLDSAVTATGVNVPGASIAPAPASVPLGAEWVWEHMPVTHVQIEGSWEWERRSLLAVAVLILAVVVITVVGFFPLVMALALLPLALAATLYTLYRRFSALTERSAKQQLERTARQVRGEVQDAESTARRIRAELDTLNEREARDLAELKAKLAKVDVEEQAALARIANDVGRARTQIDARQKALQDAEARERAARLHQVQRDALDSALRRFDLDRASIAGIGDALKLRLKAAGVRSAADLLGVHVPSATYGRYQQSPVLIEVVGHGRVRIPGIGPAKAQALASWRQGLESALQSRLPRSLPVAESNAIQARYQAQVAALALERNKAASEADAAKSAAQAKHRAERNALNQALAARPKQTIAQRRDLGQQIEECSRVLADKRWARAKAERELQAYQDVIFSRYLRSVLGLVDVAAG